MGVSVDQALGLSSAVTSSTRTPEKRNFKIMWSADVERQQGQRTFDQGPSKGKSSTASEWAMQSVAAVGMALYSTQG